MDEPRQVLGPDQDCTSDCAFGLLKTLDLKSRVKQTGSRLKCD